MFDHNHTDRTGGAIHSRGGFTIKGGSLTANPCAGGGGAIAVIPLGEYASTPNFTLEDVIIGGSAENANHSSSNAGAVYVGKGNCTITGSTSISFNHANGNGGGVYVNDGSLIMNDGAIESNYTENAASGNGAGIYVNGKGVTVNISGGSISRNSANVTNAHGGGIYVADAASVTISGGTIESNHSAGDGGGLDIGGASASITIGSADHATTHPDNAGFLSFVATLRQRVAGPCASTARARPRSGAATLPTIPRQAPPPAPALSTRRAAPSILAPRERSRHRTPGCASTATCMLPRRVSSISTTASPSPTAASSRPKTRTTCTTTATRTVP